MTVEQATSYPAPPWTMHGEGTVAAYAVPAAELRLPPGVEPLRLAGRCVGLLAYVEYRPPSPLCYRELIWMPAMVRVRAANGQRLRGYHVAKIYVDDPTTLAAGRAEWSLPKTWAQFERRGERLTIEADDGSAVALRLRPRGPALPARQRMSTVQVSDDEIIGFRSTFTCKLGVARLQATLLRAGDDGWRSFERARRLPSPAASLRRFIATMHPPRRLPRGVTTP